MLRLLLFNPYIVSYYLPIARGGRAVKMTIWKEKQLTLQRLAGNYLSLVNIPAVTVIFSLNECAINYKITKPLLKDIFVNS